MNYICLSLKPYLICASPESVEKTVRELEENLKEAMVSGSKTQTHSKVVGIACDVCDPDDVHKLASFAVRELGSIDIWVSNLLAFFLC